MRERSWRGPDPKRSARMLVAMLGLGLGAGLAVHHPIAPAAALVAFVLWSVSVAWRPGLWLFVVPAALPWLNFSPWTGWVVFEEFDLLMLGVVAGGYAHRALSPVAAPDSAARRSRQRAIFLGVAMVFGAAATVGLVRGMTHYSAGGDEASLRWFQSYADPVNSLRVFKSVLYAGLVWPLLHEEIRIDAVAAVRRLGAGMLAGLAVVVATVLWERAAYPGLWDFSSRYRTTALFWEMHVGGAAIDAYLALAAPFVAWALWSSRSRMRWAAAALLALLTGYACLTTFSRGVYAGVAGPLVLLGLLLLSRRGAAVRATMMRTLGIGALLGAVASLALVFDAWPFAGTGLLLLGLGAVLLRSKRPMSYRWRPAATVGLCLALALEAGAVVGLGSFMRERLAASDRDLDGRLAHWRHGLGLMQGPADWIWGIGLGRIPSTYAREVPGQEFPGDVKYIGSGADPGSGSVRVSGPKTYARPNGLYTLTQRVPISVGAPAVVHFDVRSPVKANIYIRLCEMHLLYPRHCQFGWLNFETRDEHWHRLEIPLRGPRLEAGYPWSPRLGVFSLAVVNAGGVADFDNLGLSGAVRAGAIGNGDFARGLAQWYPSAQGYYVPWHIDNLYLEVLIELGAPALLAFVMCVGFALWRSVSAGGRAATIAPFLAASLSGALCIGAVSSVLDVPRVAFLLLLLVLFAVEITGRGRDITRPSGAPDPESAAPSSATPGA